MLLLSLFIYAFVFYTVNEECLLLRSLYVVIAYCVPRNAIIRFEYRMENRNKRPVRQVTSRQEVLNDDTLGTYFYDSQNG